MLCNVHPSVLLCVTSIYPIFFCSLQLWHQTLLVYDEHNDRGNEVSRLEKRWVGIYLSFYPSFSLVHCIIFHLPHIIFFFFFFCIITFPIVFPFHMDVGFSLGYGSRHSCPIVPFTHTRLMMIPKTCTHKSRRCTFFFVILSFLSLFSWRSFIQQINASGVILTPFLYI